MAIYEGDTVNGLLHIPATLERMPLVWLLQGPY